MVGGGGGGGKDVPFYKTLTAIVAFTSTNIGLNIFNSWALRRHHWPDFEFPIFYTMWHMLVTSMAALLLLATVNPAPTGMPTRAQFWAYRHGLLAIAACTTCNTGLNNMSLTMVSLYINQVIKACAPLPTAFFSYLLAGKTFSRPVITSVAAIVLGSILANAHAMTQKGGSENSLFGVLICATSLLANALKPVLAMKTMDSSNSDLPKLAPTVVLFYDAGLSFFFMLTYWLLSSERDASLHYLEDPHTTFVGVGIVLVGASMAFGFNLAVYYFVLYTSALTSTVGANAIKILLITVSALSAGVSDFLSWFGISLVVAAMGMYAYLNFTEKKPPPKEPAPTKNVPPPAGISCVPPSGLAYAAHACRSTEHTPLVNDQTPTHSGNGGSRV